MSHQTDWLQWIEVDLDAIAHNVTTIKSLLRPGTRFMAVVKKNAYGHGAAAVSRAALEAGADYLAVYSIEEAVGIRLAGSNAPIVILGPVLPNKANTIIEQCLTPTVVDREFACALSAAAQEWNRVVEVHVKVDTGLNRYGASLEEAPELINYLSTLPNIKVVGLYTHFSSADEPDETPTKLQLERFLKVARLFPQIELLHAANSAATLRFPETHLNMVRVGEAIYGYYPSAACKTVPLRPALSVKTRIVRVHSIKAEEGVSYGLTWVAPKESIVALIPFGYGHGLPRILSNRGQVLVKGKRAPIRGVVCMDQSIIDVTEMPGVKVGDEAVIIGRQGEEHITAAEVARLAQTIDYEIVTRLPMTLPRIYLRKGAA